MLGRQKHFYEKSQLIGYKLMYGQLLVSVSVISYSLTNHFTRLSGVLGVYELYVIAVREWLGLESWGTLFLSCLVADDDGCWLECLMWLCLLGFFIACWLLRKLQRAGSWEREEEGSIWAHLGDVVLTLIAYHRQSRRDISIAFYVLEPSCQG